MPLALGTARMMELATTIMIAPLLQVICQHVNFGTTIMCVRVMTNLRSRYQIVHAFNTMFAAVNFLPGQVRLPPIQRSNQCPSLRIYPTSIFSIP